MSAGIFLALCLHLVPVVDTWFGQVGRFSRCVLANPLALPSCPFSY